MLTVWGRRNAFNVQKVMWLVAELGLEHRHIQIGGKFGGLDDPAFLQVNPHGRVPVIEHNGTIVWESHTILRYLADLHGAVHLWPQHLGERSLVDRWMDWFQTSLQPAFLNNVFGGFYKTPENERDWAFIEEGLRECARLFVLLDAWLGDKDYMCGPGITLADIAIGTVLYRYFSIAIERPKIPGVEAWYRRLEDRPAYREHVMLPFDDLRRHSEGRDQGVIRSVSTYGKAVY